MDPEISQPSPEKQARIHWALVRSLLPPLIFSVACLAAARINYLFFHSLAEIFSIVIGFTAMVIATTAARFTKNHFIVFLSIAIGWCGGIDLIHTLVFKGMRLWNGESANPVAARDKDNIITKRFMPVVLLSESPNILVVHPSVKASTAKELIELARSSAKDTLSYGSAGQGTASHLSGVLFADAIGFSMVHVPYKGTGPAQIDLLAGRIPLMFDNLINGLANAKAGKVKALAVTSTRRWPGAPELPTLAEVGLPNTDLVSVFGLMAPVGTPKAVIDRISSTLLQGMAAPEIRARLNQIGFEPGTLNAQAYGAYLDTQVQRWEKLVAAGKLDLK